VAAAAREDGVALDPEAMIARIESVPPGVRSSMQKDREAGRPTEIDAIGGSVLRALLATLSMRLRPRRSSTASVPASAKKP
jgi:hypothetical protein